MKYGGKKQHAKNCASGEAETKSDWFRRLLIHRWALENRLFLGVDRIAVFSVFLREQGIDFTFQLDDTVFSSSRHSIEAFEVVNGIFKLGFAGLLLDGILLQLSIERLGCLCGFGLCSVE